MAMNDDTVDRAKKIIGGSSSDETARQLYSWYDAYIRAGFDKDTALKIVFKLLDLGMLSSLNARKK